MYTPDLISAVGPEQYGRLAHASSIYERAGFRYTHAPWLVQQKVDHATKPSFAKPIHHHSTALNHTFHFAASGEQSFIQMQFDALKNGGPAMTGRWQTITPCFRDETAVNELRRIGFMKLELIDWQTPTLNNLNNIINVAYQYFSRHIECDVIPNDQTSETGHDIVSRKYQVELGSYGMRSNTVGGFPMAWTYATGLAEPRLSVAIAREKCKYVPIYMERS